MKSGKLLTLLWDYILMTVGSVIFCMACNLSHYSNENGIYDGSLL